MNKKPNTRFQPSLDARLIFELLMKCEVGRTITYEQIGEVVGKERVTSATTGLYTALRWAEQEDVVFGSVRGLGYRRLSDEEIATTVGEAGMRRIRRASTRLMGRVARAKDENISEEAKIRRNAAVSMFGVLAHMTKRHSVKKLEENVERHDDQLAVGRVLDLFRNS